MKRKLTDLEKSICGKQVKNLRDELDHLNWLVRYNDMMLSEGLYRNYQEKLREFKLTKQQLIGDIHNVVDKLRILQQQIDEGVEIKKDEGEKYYG